MWLFGPGPDTTVVDVTAGVDRKLAALLAHQSQIGDWDVETFVRARLQARGEAHGLAYAEGFRVISFRR